MDVYVFKLKFKGPTHFGETGIDLENVSERVGSDTLFSALVNAHKEVYGIKETTEFVENYSKKPQFIISSLFVYLENKIFLPRPLIDLQIDNEIKRNYGKDLKKLKWLDLKGFENWLKGNINDEEIERMKSLQIEYSEAYTTEIRPRVTLDRTTSQSNIYHSGFVYFAKNAGLYGLVAFTDGKFIKNFQTMLEILGQIGLGGEKTYGCGMFEIEMFERAPEVFKGILFEKYDTHVILSLYHPNKEEMSSLKEKAIAYDIVRKRGWITTGRYALSYKRKSIGFFVEGSVFKNRLMGTLVDVTPDELENELPHRIFRSGYAFTIPF